MRLYASPYTIHFDDTMAYGSHHFLTAFKFQCAGRESLLYGDLIFDKPGVPEALDQVHLFTADAYSRNLSPVFLGDRVAILITLEEWGRVSARFCYRMIGQQGQAICAGFQTMICADAQSGQPIPLPESLRLAFEAIREIEEPYSEILFRDQVLKGAEATQRLFNDEIRSLALGYLEDRYPVPRIIGSPHDNVVAESAAGAMGYVPSSTMPQTPGALSASSVSSTSNPTGQRPASPPASSPDQKKTESNEVWAFPGQGAFDALLLCDRIAECTRETPALRSELDRCAQIATQELGGNAAWLVSGDIAHCLQAVKETPSLAQVAIHLQSVLGARLRSRLTSPRVLMGHSFGELAALNVAGCFDLVTGVRVVCQRVRAVSRFGPSDGGLLVAATSRRRVAEELAVYGLSSLSIAGRNHERQTVVSGPKQDLERLKAQLALQEIESVSVPSPTSFHHPSLRSAATEWFQSLKQLTFGPPQIAVYSPIGRNLVTANDDIPTILSSHFLRPFDLMGAIDDLVSGGTTTFVDCGSSGMFTRLLTAAGPDGLSVIGINDPPVADRPDGVTPQSAISPEVAAFSATGHSPGASGRPADVSQSASANQPASITRPTIAIVGQGCLLPGRSTSPAELYAAITQQRLGIVDQRIGDPDWERDFFSETLVSDRSTSALGGKVDDRDVVTPLNIDDGLFQSFSRAQQILCVALSPCIDAIRNAERVVCLIGSTADGYRDQDGFAALRFAGVNVEDPEIVRRMGDERSVNQDPFIAIQEVFDRVIRPGIDVRLVDAACASSLYSIALGMQELEENAVDLVLAGGVFCPGPGNNCLFSQFGGLTSTGCRPFDGGADGVVFSEGAAMVVLQRLADARAQGSSIHAVIKGAGLSSDGKSSSANVPQSAGQILALERCYANYSVTPQSIVAIEAHGTSTPVGDATELKTLRNFFSDKTDSPLPVHSLKGLIGHSGWAAGVASVIAATESLRNRAFPAQAFYTQPSAELAQSKETLTVVEAPFPLVAQRNAIAIDGFGFGGSNAHVVVETCDAMTAEETPVPARDLATADDQELVLVGWHELSPTTKDTSGCKRFGRNANLMPDGMLVLPDLADDMDISQALALSAVDGTLKQLGGIDDDLRSATSIVLAQGGKTERAVEATIRILKPRLERKLAGTAAASAVGNAANNIARPSGAYTLQCMMPNVSAGRAALQFNLNGPNFVVDSGAQSLESAIRSAGTLLRNGKECGTKLALVLTISANRYAVPNADSAVKQSEFAMALAMTTKKQARELGLDVVTTMDELIANSGIAACESTEQKVAAIATSLHSTGEPGAQPTGLAPVKASRTPREAAAKARETLESQATPEPDEQREDFPVHAPVWVQMTSAWENPRALGSSEAWLVVAEANEELVKEIFATISDYCERFRVVLVGPSAAELAQRFADPKIIVADVSSESAAIAALSAITQFGPDVVVAMDRANSWSVTESLSDAASNELCEFLFLTMKSLVSDIRKSKTEVWGLFPDSWRGAVHPVTGAVTGLVKAARREMPDSRMGVLTCSSGSVRDAIEGLQYERSCPDGKELEIVHHDSRRYVRRLRPTISERVESGESPVNPDGAVSLDSNSVVLASGGARGVTAVAVEALVRDYGCTVICFGRSPLERGPRNDDLESAEAEYYARYVAENPSANPLEMRKSFLSAQARWEAQDNIDRMSQLGGTVRYMPLDVTDQAAVETAIQQIAAEFGRVDFLIHGAGVQWSKKLESRTLDEFRKTFDVKVSGLHHLVNACQRQLGRVVPANIFTSAYSIFGNDGQHDYGAANETMDRLCGISTIQPEATWSSIAWSAWDGIGMTRGTEYRALAERRNLTLLGAAGGARIFRDVIEGRTAAKINVALSDAERTRYGMRTLPPRKSNDVLRSSELPLQLSGLGCLPFHLARGVPTLPGAWIFNYMVEAVLKLHGQHAEFLSIEDMQFQRFIRFANENDANIRIVVDELPDSEFAVWMIGNVLHPDGETLLTDVVYSQARISISHSSAMHGVSLNGIATSGEGTIPKIRLVDDPYCADGETVRLSGPFDCLKQIEIGDLGRRAIFSPDTTVNWEGVVPSLLLDASLRVAGMHVADGLHVPTRVDRAVVPVGFSADSSAAVGWRIRTCAPEVIGDDIRCDRIEVVDANGELRLCIEGTRVTRLR